MIGPFGRQGLASTLMPHCHQMTRRRCTLWYYGVDLINILIHINHNEILKVKHLKQVWLQSRKYQCTPFIPYSDGNEKRLTTQGPSIKQASVLWTAKVELSENSGLFQSGFCHSQPVFVCIFTLSLQRRTGWDWHKPLWNSPELSDNSTLAVQRTDVWSATLMHPCKFQF